MFEVNEDWEHLMNHAPKKSTRETLVRRSLRRSLRRSQPVVLPRLNGRLRFPVVL